jgi:hypothetical protein
MNTLNVLYKIYIYSDSLLIYGTYAYNTYNSYCVTKNVYNYFTNRDTVLPTVNNTIIIETYEKEWSIIDIT